MRIGFIGIGNLGWPIAVNVHKAGHDVTVFDADRAKAARFATEHGGRAATGLADVARNDFVVTILPTGDMVRQALLKDEGGAFIDAIQPGTIVIDMGSSDPLGTRALGARLREKGAHLVDAPVSKRGASFVASATGATPGAATGTLVIMIGGDDADAIARAKPLLLTMGDRLFETGALGTAHATKALNNYASAATHIALAEALLVGQRFGLDPQKMIEIVNESTGRSFVSEVLFKNWLANDKFATGFTIGLMAKDVKVARELFDAMDFHGPLAAVTEERWNAARDKLGPNSDITAAVPAWDEDAK